MLINAGGLPVILQNSQDVNPDIRESALHLLQGLAENGCVESLCEPSILDQLLLRFIRLTVTFRYKNEHTMLWNG